MDSTKRTDKDNFEEIISGFKVRHNKNGFVAVKMHYTSDPDKASEEWYEKTRRGYTEAAWNREYEMDFGALGGELVFGDYFSKYSDKIIIPTMEPPRSWPKYGSMDYGTLSPTAFLVYTIDNDGSIIFIWEYYSPGPLPSHAKAIINCPYYYDLAWITIDPSMTHKTQNVDGNLKSIQDLLDDGYDIITIPGDNDRFAGWERIKWHWRDLSEREPTLKITRDCPNLIRELKNLRYAEWSPVMSQKRNPKEDTVKKDDHAADACRYAIMSQPRIVEPSSLDGTGLVAPRRARRMTRRNVIARNTFDKKQGHPILGKYYE